MSLPELLRSCGALRFGEFTLSSGKTSPYYVDVKEAATDPAILGRMAQDLASHVEDEDRLAGLALGAVPLVVATSLEAQAPYLLVRKEAKDHGTGSRLEGDHAAGEEGLLVEDVTTTGSSACDAVEALREADLVVERCVTVVDRGEGAEKTLEEIGVTLEALVGASELMEARP
jgi:orotate phosphoribosyltransferase